MSERAKHSQITASVIHNNGLTPVRVNTGDKAPLFGPEFGTADEIMSANEAGRCNMAVHFFSSVIDVDVDTFDPNITAAMQVYMPSCMHVYGRRSKERSHWIYRLPAEISTADLNRASRIFRNMEDPTGNVAIEIRGGDKDSKRVSVVPGSVHPSGEEIHWHNISRCSATLSVVSLDEVVTGIKRSVAAALISRLWISGIRNELSVALSGALYGIRQAFIDYHKEMKAIAKPSKGEDEEPDSIIDDADIEEMAWPSYNEAESFVKLVCELAGDDKEDLRTRIANLKNTWKKAEASPSNKLTGFNKIREVVGADSAKTVNNIIRLLLPNEEASQMLEKLSNFVKIRRPTGLEIMDIAKYESGAVSAIQPFRAFKECTGSEKLYIGDKCIPLADFIKSTNLVPMYDIFAYRHDKPRQFMNEAPIDGEIYGPTLNMWRDTWVKEWPEPVDENDPGVAKFLYYIREVICNGVDAQFKWVLSWLADIVRDPVNKPSTCIVLVGRQGAGKSFLGEVVMKSLLNDKFIAVDGIESFSGDFNEEMSNKILVQADEVTHNSASASISERLKRLISSKRVIINPKNMAKREERDMRRFLFTTNHRTSALKMDGDRDRRYSVIEVSDRHATDVKFYGEFHAMINTVEWPQKVMKYLRTYSGYDKSVKHSVLRTETKDIMVSTFIPTWVRLISAAAYYGNFAVGSYDWNCAYRIADYDVIKKSQVPSSDRWPELVDTDRIAKAMSTERGAKFTDAKLFLDKFVSGDPVTSVEVLTINNKVVRSVANLRRIDGPDKILASLVSDYGKPLLMAINADLDEDYVTRVRSGEIPTVCAKYEPEAVEDY